MKKMFFLLGLFLLGNGFFVVAQTCDEQANQHPVAKNEDSLIQTGSGFVSVTYANISVENEQDFKDIFPKLHIVGEVTDEKLVLIQKVLQNIPADKLQSFYTLKIIHSKNGKRGLGGAHTVIINDYQLSDQEFVSVLVHELGHVIDLGGITGSPNSFKSVYKDGPNPIFVDDLSVQFYNYSWLDNYQHKPSVNRLDFVSGYAMTDPFEDFAESFIYYTFHNQEFQLLAQNNQVLQQKYDFIKNYVFDGKDLKTGTSRLISQKRRVWDITKLAIEF